MVAESLESRRLLSAYTITDLGELPSSDDNGSTGAVAFSVNDAGQVVGYALHKLGGQSAAFIWTQADGMQQLTPVVMNGQPEPNVQSEALGISDNGRVVGFSDTQAVVWFNGAGGGVTQLALAPGYTVGSADAISFDGRNIGGQSFGAIPDSGNPNQYVGTVWGPVTTVNIADAQNITGIQTAGGGTGVLMSGNIITEPSGFSEATYNGDPIGYLPGDNVSQSFGLNTVGQVVGFSESSGSNPIQQAFIYSTDSGMQPMGFLSHGTMSVANAINDSATAVGSSTLLAGSQQHAFVWTKAAGMKDLNDLIPANTGWKLVEANGISDTGLIVGDGTNPQGQEAAFLLTPTNETGGPGAISGSIVSTTLPSVFVPGESGRVNVSLKNTGSGIARGSLTAQAYVSPDGQLSDATLLPTSGRKVFSTALRSEQSSTLGLSFTVPGSIATGTQQLLVTLTAVSGLSGALPSSPIVYFTPLQATLGFGTVGGRRNTRLVETLAGVETTFSLAGPGSGTLTPDGNGGFALSLAGTTVASTVNISAAGMNSLDSISAVTPIGNLNAPKVTVNGNITLTGGARSARFDDVTNSSISLGGALPARLTFAAVTNSSLFSTAPVQSLTVGGWNSPLSVQVPSIGSFLDKGSFTGTFAATGSIGSVSIDGSLTGDVLAGVSLGANGQPGGGDDVFAAASIRSIRVLGDATSSIIAAGLDTMDDVFPLDGTETLLAGSRIDSLSIGGALSNDSKVLTALPPKTVSIDHARVVTASDARFQL